MPGPERSPERAATPASAMPAHAPPPAGAALVPASRGLSVAEAARAATVSFRPLRRSSELLLRQADLVIAGSPGALLAPAAATPPPAEPLPRLPADGVEPQPRFARTLAELERYQVASRWQQRATRIVPRPALARPDQSDAAGAPWSRLSARRKDPAAE